MGKYGLDNINKPAYDAAHEEIEELRGEVPTDAEITALANAAIQADKDILSKITVEYDETNDETKFIFPKGVMPIKFYCYFTDELNGTFFPDYDNGKIIDDEGAIVQECSITKQNLTKIRLSVSGNYTNEFTSELFYDMMYINYINDDGGDYYNWYKILKPQSGTKLYKHSIEITADNGDFHCEFSIINTVYSEYDTEAFEEESFIVGVNCLAISYDYGDSNWFFSPYSITLTSGDLTASLIGFGQNRTEYTYQFNVQGSERVVSDTVTEL